ncbi:hypothetical protein FQN57_000154 [Myotisia sp. PD_48]|nr:hypothetical protein FQN57_000154 [Myotisia sp. PD_48]
MQTARLNLVRLSPDHLRGYHSVWSDPYGTRWSEHGPCKTLEESNDWMSGTLLDKNPKGEMYAVLLRPPNTLNQLPTTTTVEGDQQQPDFLRLETVAGTEDESGQFIGVIGTWKSDPVPELGFIFHRFAWHQGFATEALNAWLELFWKRKPEFDVVEAYADTENHASLKVLRKCGFEQVEIQVGASTLPAMQPPSRDLVRFDGKRKK